MSGTEEHKPTEAERSHELFATPAEKRALISSVRQGRRYARHAADVIVTDDFTGRYRDQDWRRYATLIGVVYAEAFKKLDLSRRLRCLPQPLAPRTANALTRETKTAAVSGFERNCCEIPRGS